MSIQDHHSPQLTEQDRSLILAEQTKLLFAAMPLSVFATVLNALILVAVQWSVVDQGYLVLWFSAMLLVMLYRSLLTVGYHRANPGIEESKAWLEWFHVGVVLVGMVWAGASIWLFPSGNIAHQVFVAFVMAGMSAGAAASLSFQRFPIIVYLTFLLVPTVTRFLMEDETLSRVMGGMIALFFVIMMFTSLKFYRNTYQNIALRIEAVAREKALRESEEKYQHIFHAAPLGVVHYDAQGVVTECNGTFCGLIGIDCSSLLGSNLLHAPYDTALQDAVHRSLVGKYGRFEGSSKAFGGSREADVRVFCRGIELDDGSIAGGVVIVVDVSEDKRVERIKNEFVSTVSHELRTPLTAIRGAVGLLRGNVVGELSEEGRKLINIAQDNTERLLALINEILEFDKVEAGIAQLHMKPWHVMTLLEDAKHAADAYARQFQIQLGIVQRADAAVILVDYERMMQVLSHLLSNAIKFSPSGADVELSARTTDGRVEITVTDYGCGIPEDFRPLIFERFSQADSSDSRRAGGTGLGLSIAKVLVDRQGGQIEFFTSDKGTTFVLEFPLDGVRRSSPPNTPRSVENDT